MSGQLSLLPMVLPGLAREASAAHIGDVKTKDGWRHHPAVRALLDAAQDGFYTHQGGARDPVAPKLWYRWCAENRHPPVEVHLKRKWAKVYCRHWTRCGVLDAAGAPAVREVMRRFQMRDKPKAKGGKGCCLVHAGGESGYAAYVHGPTVEQAADCARCLVDLLCEFFVYPPGVRGG